MAWESRGTGTYYYVKRWVNGKVESTYCGQGEIGGLFAFSDGRARHERLMARLELQSFVQEQQRVDRALSAYRHQVSQLVKSILVSVGYHQHKGQWRLKRTMVNEVAKMTKDEEIDEYTKLFKAAQGKDKQAVAKLSAFADSHPTVFDGFSMLSQITLDDVIPGKANAPYHHIHAKGEALALQRSLGIETATPIEKLLIEDVVLCWVRVQSMEQMYSAHFKESMSFAKAAYLENRLSATRRRYLQALESLARVRGLLARVGVQINIAHQQVVTG